MTTLHTVNKPSWNSELLASCLRVARPGDALLLIEDGTYNVSTLTDVAALAGVSLETLHICALEDDLHARGLATGLLPDFIAVIDYAGFVDLACAHRQSVHWY